METLQIKQRTKITLEIYGEKYPVRKPNVKEAEAFDKKISKANSGNAISLTKEFLETLGLPRKVSDDLETDHFMQVADFLMGAKKK